MAIVKSNRPKIPELDRDNIRRLFTKSITEWLKENASELDEKPSKEEVSDIVTDLVALWADPLEIMVDTAVDTMMLSLMSGDDEDDTDDESDESDSDVLDAEIVDE